MVNKATLKSVAKIKCSIETAKPNMAFAWLGCAKRSWGWPTILMEAVLKIILNFIKQLTLRMANIYLMNILLTETKCVRCGKKGYYDCSNHNCEEDADWIK